MCWWPVFEPIAHGHALLFPLPGLRGSSAFSRGRHGGLVNSGRRFPLCFLRQHVQELLRLEPECLGELRDVPQPWLCAPASQVWTVW